MNENIYFALFVFCLGFLIGYLISIWVAPTDKKYSEMKESQDLISFLLSERDGDEEV